MLEPGVYFAINSPGGAVGALPVDAVLTAAFGLAVWVLLADVARVCWRSRTGRSVTPSSETSAVPTRLRTTPAI